MRVNWASYYFIALYLPAGYIFYMLVTWATCKPISQLESYLHLLKSDHIPKEATCFLDNHMTRITFFSYPPFEENLPYVYTLVLILLLLVGLCLKPTKRLLIKPRN